MLSITHCSKNTLYGYFRQTLTDRQACLSRTLTSTVYVLLPAICECATITASFLATMTSCCAQPCTEGPSTPSCRISTPCTSPAPFFYLAHTQRCPHNLQSKRATATDVGGSSSSTYFDLSQDGCTPQAVLINNCIPAIMLPYQPTALHH